jgi:hypothetical protein
MAKFACTVLALLFALTVGAAWAAPVPKRAEALALPDLPEKVVEEWTSVGGTYGWFRVDAYGDATFEPASKAKRTGAPGDLPGFAFENTPTLAPFSFTGYRAAQLGAFGNLGGQFGLEGSHTEFRFCELTKPGRSFALTFTNGYVPTAQCGLHNLPHLRTVTARSKKEASNSVRIFTEQGLRIANASPSYDDAALKHFAGLKSLQTLSLNAAPVGDDGLKYVAALTELQWLDLGGTKITGAGLKHLAALPNLSRLRLADTRTEDAGLAHLARHRELTHLDLRNTAVSDAGLKHLAAHDALVELNLSGTNVTADGLKALACLPRLRKLDLSRTKVTDRDLDVLLACTELRELNLRDTRVTATGLKRLSELKKLAPHLSAKPAGQ